MEHTGETPAVDVVIVNWNTAVIAATAARSYAGSQGVAANITIVDNGSRTHDRRLLKSICPDGVHLVLLERNLGYGAAVNQGLADGDGEVVCVSNADVEVEPNALAKLASTALRSATAGMVGPVFEGSANGYHHPLPSPPVLLARTFVGSVGRNGYEMPGTEQVRPVDQPSGACFAVRRSVWEQFGGFDQSFFLWYEDVDLAKRLLDSGYSNLVVGSARAVHTGAVAFELIERRRWQAIRLPSLERYIRKHHSSIVPLAIPLIRLSSVARIRERHVKLRAATRPSVKRFVKKQLVSAPSALRDSRALRGAFHLRETVGAAVGDYRHRSVRATDGLPVPPARLRVAVSGIADPADHLDAGIQSAEAIRSLLHSNELSVQEFGSMLDFGCGSGRVARQWVGLTETAVHGCDYNANAIAWCRENLPFAKWSTNALAPPLPYADEQFSFVYGLSVFTHFHSRMQDPWMVEMRRVLSPDGYLVFTTMGESFRSHLPLTDHGRFDAGDLIVHFPNSAGTNMCAAYHPKPYVDDLLDRAGLSLVDWVPAGEDSLYPQDMWLVQPRP